MDFSSFDLDTQAEDLKRRQAVINALAERSVQPTLGDTVMGMFGRGSSDRMAELQQAYARDNAAHQQRYQGQLGQELEAFLSKMQGTPARPPAPDYAGNAVGPTAPAEPGNPREAIIRAMTSQLPEMQKMGKTQMDAIGKPRDITEHVIGGQIIRSDKVNPPQVAGTYGSEWGPVESIGTAPNGQPLLGQRNKQSGEVKYAPAGQTINVGDKGQTKVQDAAIKAMGESRTQTMSLQGILDTSQRVLTLLDDPQVQTGFAASPVTGAMAIGAKLGWNGEEGVAKTQSLAGELAKNTLAAGQSMKGSFSDKDIEFLTAASLGKIDFNAAALKRIALLAYMGGHNEMFNADAQYNGAASIPGLEGMTSVLPKPKVTWDARIGDRPEFERLDGGRLRYVGDTVKPAAAGGRKRMSAAEFLAGGQ